MVKKIHKIRVKNSKDDDLIKECQNATGTSTSQSIEWTTPPKATRIHVPSDTAAVVVDLVDDPGAIRIYEKENDAYVNIVGTEEAGNMVIVAWESTWWFRVSGSLRVGYIKAKHVE